MADVQEVAALKLDLELVKTRTEEIRVKVDGVEDKVTALSAQFSRLESLLLVDREQRQSVDSTQQQDVEKERAATLQRQHQTEHERARGHSKPPHWRRRLDAQEPPRYDTPSQEVEGETYDHHVDDMY